MGITPYIGQLRITLKEQTRYFFSDSLISSVSVLIHTIVVLLFYQATGLGTFFATFTWAMLVWYIIATQLIKGIQSDLINVVSNDIQTGDIITRLNKPYSYTIALLFAHIGYSMMQVTSCLILLVPLGVIWGGLAPITLLGVIAFTIACALALLMDYYISLSIGMLAIWTEDAKPYRWIYSKIIFIFGGVLFPLDIFPPMLRTIAKALPPAFMIYYPARLLVDFSWELLFITISGLLAYTLLFAVISLFVTKKGNRRLSVNGG